jgi:hypothetical protein
MIPAGHQITWAEFKQAFKEHHIPKGLMDRKMKELLALKQGTDTVYEYAKKFNALCQYGGHHVDNDAKKIERFRDGLLLTVYFGTPSMFITLWFGFDYGTNPPLTNHITSSSMCMHLEVLCLCRKTWT